jgi:vitamin K-dependent gamma-carboxylase
MATELGRWREPVDAAGLVAFRSLLGLVLVFAIARFALNGWIDELLVRPAFHFRYWGFGWLPRLPEQGLYVAFGGMMLAAAGLALGRWPRALAFVFCLLFTYCELLDQTLYLNHYYLVSLLTGMLALLPTGQRSAQSQAEAARADCVVARGVYWALRVQVGLVYFYAGLAKVNADWMGSAEPLRTWLAAFADVPLLGPLLDSRGTAYAMSWAGAGFDLGVPFLLLWRKSRALAYGVLVSFHGVIWLLFPVGAFSWVMVVAATVFFEPDWPRRVPMVGSWFARMRAACGSPAGWARPQAVGPLVTILLLHLVIQAVLPLRHYLYPGDVNWTNEGFRFAWRVMLVEKTGHVEYLIEREGRTERLYPERELSRLQYAQMSVQPDMIHQYARHVAERYRRREGVEIAIRADAWAQLNGRASQRLIDPSVDLSALEPSLGHAKWIVPLQSALR